MSGAWRSKRARVQVEETELPSSVPPQTGLAYNVWYNKWSQGQSGNARFVSPFKLDVDNDSGRTKGDKENKLYFCLYFAKGMCCLGKNCSYLHHIPEAADFARMSLHSNALDCFGREKFADYRDDMGGIGSFRRPNRVLYIGGITGSLNNKPLKGHQIENRIKLTFSRLGELDSVRYVESKNCAFVKFKLQCNAEFAKEAMSNQTLLVPSDKEWDQRKEGTGLLVKWANPDPNPAVRKQEEEELTKHTLEAIKHLLNENQQRKKRTITDIDDTANSKSSSNFSTIESHTIINPSILAKLKKRKLILRPTACVSHLGKLEQQKKPLVNSYSSEED